MLQDYSRDVVAADNMNASVSITSLALAALFQVPVVVMLVTEGSVVSLEQVGGRLGEVRLPESQMVRDRVQE